jgi:hypothetical protein
MRPESFILDLEFLVLPDVREAQHFCRAFRQLLACPIRVQTTVLLELRFEDGYLFLVEL